MIYFLEHWSRQGQRINTHINSTTTVVLDNLVRGVIGTTADDPSLLARLVVFLPYYQT
jgi:hypothetical protein